MMFKIKMTLLYVFHLETSWPLWKQHGVGISPTSAAVIIQYR